MIYVQMDKGARGQFARFVVQVNLSQPLVSKVCIMKKIIKLNMNRFR